MSGFQVVVFLLVWFVPHSKAHFIGVVASIGDAFMSFHVCDDFAFVLMIQLKIARKQWWSAGYALIANPSPRIGFWAGGFNCAAGTKLNLGSENIDEHVEKRPLLRLRRAVYVHWGIWFRFKNFFIYQYLCCDVKFMSFHCECYLQLSVRDACTEIWKETL